MEVLVVKVLHSPFLNRKRQSFTTLFTGDTLLLTKKMKDQKLGI